MVEICFTKASHDAHEITVRRDAGPDIRRRARETGPTIPHDLAHAAVESALGIDDGFWGAVARGVTFEDFEPLEGRHRRSGLKVLRRDGDAVMRAELIVSWSHRVWCGASTEGLRPPDGCDDDTVRRAGIALDDAASRWAGVAVGDALTWRW